MHQAGFIYKNLYMMNGTMKIKFKKTFSYIRSGRKPLQSHERIHEINLEKTKSDCNMRTDEHNTLTNNMSRCFFLLFIYPDNFLF